MTPRLTIAAATLAACAALAALLRAVVLGGRFGANFFTRCARGRRA